MTFQDIFRNSFLKNVTTYSPIDMLLTLFLSLLAGMIIFFVYRKTYQNVVYTRSFNISLVMMTLITSLVIMAVTSNIILSLGMVGALSIVRFRTAVKDPMDIVFMFWSIAAGIVIGAGLYFLGIGGSLIIGVILIVFHYKVQSESPYVLIVCFSREDAEDDVLSIVRASTGRFRVKSKSVDSSQIELIIELRVRDKEMSFVSELNHVESVSRAMLVSSGEYIS